jgi:hypothetical protein
MNLCLCLLSRVVRWCGVVCVCGMYPYLDLALCLFRKIKLPRVRSFMLHVTFSGSWDHPYSTVRIRTVPDMIPIAKLGEPQPEMEKQKSNLGYNQSPLVPFPLNYLVYLVWGRSVS